QEHPSEILAKVKAFEAEDQGQSNVGAKWQGTSRRVGVGSQILAQLGVTKMRLLSSPKRYHSLSGFGLEVTECVADDE
ncbi:MAG: bifunctional 3,4-dihydroxy-2-butanone-4-phosphate synthase/GTP cyclohydrolase II, partial [Shewanella sp.]